MSKEDWLAITIDDIKTLAETADFDIEVLPSPDSDEPMAVENNPLGDRSFNAPENDLLKELAICAITGEPEEFVSMIDTHMESLFMLALWEENVEQVITEGLKLGISRKCGASACMLGALYYDGSFVDQNYEKAAELYEIAADLGNYQAVINLGYIYEYGRIGKPDYIKAYMYYSLAATLAESSEAIYKMGDLLERGRGIEKNHKEAVKLWQKSREITDDIAMKAQSAIRLAPLYLEGDSEANISQDPLAALKLYQQAEIGLRIDISKGMTYYEKRLNEAIQGQAKAREMLDVIVER